MLRFLVFTVFAAVAASANAAPKPESPRAEAATAAHHDHARTTVTDASAHERTAASRWPTVTVHKSPTCPCCVVWVEHMRAHGFDVVVNDTYETDPIRRRLGVPAGKASCHTAEVDGLVIEGHVPARDVERFLAERGDAKGLVVPGMPIGSPGMESPDGRVDRFTVERIEADGTTTPFATHGGD